MVISPTIEVWIFCLSIEVSIFWISIEVSIFCLSIDVVLPLLPRWWFLVKFQNVWARHQACQRDDLNIKFYATSISSSTLPQYQVLRYLNQNAKCRRRRRGYTHPQGQEQDGAGSPGHPVHGHHRQDRHRRRHP